MSALGRHSGRSDRAVRGSSHRWHFLHSLCATGSSRVALLWRWADGIDRMVFPRSQTSAAVRARHGRTGAREDVLPVYPGSFVQGVSKGVA